MSTGGSTISTHVLDVAAGVPARGVAVVLERADGDRITELARAVTDDDGRVRELGTVTEGVYRLRVATGAWFAAAERECFHPEVVVVFRVGAAQQHYHVPVLVSPFGYTTYRGT